MKKSLARLLAVVTVLTSIAFVSACPTTPEPTPAPPPPPPSAAPAVSAPPVIPAYSPTGDDADLKKQGAAGIEQANAATKAAELEGAIDAATTALNAAKKK